MIDPDNKARVKAWHREPWPWLLMAGPALVIVAGFYTMWLAVRSDDGLVADDYYKRGLAINQTLSRSQRATDMALSARVDLSEDAKSIGVTLKGQSATPTALRLTLVHPTRAMSDRVIELHPVAPGVYEGTQPADASGRRVIMLEDFDRTWRLDGEASAGARSITLSPHS